MSLLAWFGFGSISQDNNVVVVVSNIVVDDDDGQCSESFKLPEMALRWLGGARLLFGHPGSRNSDEQFSTDASGSREEKSFRLWRLHL